MNSVTLTVVQKKTNVLIFFIEISFVPLQMYDFD